MFWLHLLMAAVWGMLAAQFVIQACLFFVGFVVALIGLLAGAEKVPRSNNLAAVAASLSGAFVFVFLLYGGSQIVGHSLASDAEIGFSAIYIAPQLPAKLRDRWRDALHEDAMLRQAIEKAKNWTPKPQPKRAKYRVVYSDAKVEEHEFSLEEIDDRAARSTKAFERDSKPYRIAQILDGDGRAVWTA